LGRDAQFESEANQQSGTKHKSHKSLSKNPNHVLQI